MYICMYIIRLVFHLWYEAVVQSQFNEELSGFRCALHH